MQLFTCPFCGPRSEAEFHFGGDLGNLRPDGAQAVSTADWTHYLYFRNNHKGRASEVWMHLTCGEIFRMERDTVTHAVHETANFLNGGDHDSAAS
jgi:sarcosine oxidase subunit delta